MMTESQRGSEGVSEMERTVNYVIGRELRAGGTVRAKARQWEKA